MKIKQGGGYMNQKGEVASAAVIIIILAFTIFGFFSGKASGVKECQKVEVASEVK